MVPQYREYANQSLHTVSAMHAVSSHLEIIEKSIVNDRAAAGGRPLRLPRGADGDSDQLQQLAHRSEALERGRDARILR